MDVPAKILPKMVLCTGYFHEIHVDYSTRQGSLHTLIQYLRAQLPPGTIHAELRWRVMGECRSDLIEEMPYIEGPRMPLLGEKGGKVYVGIFSIFVGIDGRAELPIVKF